MRVLRLLLIGCALVLSLPLHAQGNVQLELLQLHACRSVGSFLGLRGEGLQPEHLQVLRRDTERLRASFAAIDPAQHESLQQPYVRLLASLEEGLSYGPSEDDLPWRYPEQLSRALVDLLRAADGLDGDRHDALLLSAIKLELLATQYAAQAYLGYFEATPGADGSYVSQGEQQLLAEQDTSMAQLLPLMVGRHARGMSERLVQLAAATETR